MRAARTLSLPLSYLTLSPYLTLSHYPGLSQPRPLTVSLPKCLRMRTSNFLPQTRGRPISQWQKLISVLAVSLPRLPRARSQEHSRLAPRSHHSQSPLSELALSLTTGEHRRVSSAISLPSRAPNGLVLSPVGSAVVSAFDGTSPVASESLCRVML